jgi:hypothetical protein
VHQLIGVEEVPWLASNVMHSAAHAASGFYSRGTCSLIRHSLSARRSWVSARSSTNGSSTGSIMAPPVPDLSTIKGVLFDIDGTLTNSDPLHLLA